MTPVSWLLKKLVHRVWIKKMPDWMRRSNRAFILPYYSQAPPSIV